jgi:hypothetical protein
LADSRVSLCRSHGNEAGRERLDSGVGCHNPDLMVGRECREQIADSLERSQAVHTGLTGGCIDKDNVLAK